MPPTRRCASESASSATQNGRHAVAEPQDMTALVVIPLRVVVDRADEASVADALRDVAEALEGALLARGVAVGTITARVLPARADLVAAAAKKVSESL